MILKKLAAKYRRCCAQGLIPGNSKFHFNSHMNSHFEHRCPHCDYTSRTEGRLKRHIKDFHSEVPPESFAGNRTMRNNMNNTPGRPKVYRCKQCEFVATTKVEFWVHAKMHIKEDKILQCPKCPFVTEYKHHLEYHLRNHFGSKPFKCSKCNYSCVNKSMLNSHMKSHTNVYQYRCADCTYATKYCHSLKLHLRKYNHKPATVLNLDGSLPLDDTSGDLLTPRRGPPRGPRGPRKDKDTNSMTPNVLSLPHQPQMNGPRLNLNGAILPSMYWPVLNQMTNGLHPPLPPPLIPVSNIGTLSINSLTNKLVNETIKQDPANPFKCNLCEFNGENREGLNNHMLKVHAAENQDLFSAFGISSESLVEDQMGKITSEMCKKALPAGLHITTNIETQIRGTSPQSWLQGNAPNQERKETNDVLSSSEYYFKTSSPSYNSRPVSRESDGSTASVVKENGEIPLDLTKPKDAQADGTDSDTPQPKTKAHAPSTPPFSRKRRLLEGQVCSSPTDELMQHGSPNPSLSPTPRKRSRKGKAYKLDTICMKLQEQCPESPEAYDSDEYSSDHVENRTPAAGGESGGSGKHKDNETGSDQEGMPDDVQSNIDYGEIHDNLNKLNDETGQYGYICGNGLKPVKPSPYQRLNMLANTIEASLQLRQQQQTDMGNVVAVKNEQNNKSDEFEDSPLPLTNGNGPMSSDDSLSDPVPADGSNQVTGTGHNITMKGDNFECQYCDIAFRDCVMYTMHMGYHGYQDPFQCNNCGYHAKDKVDFFLHIARVAHT